VVDRSEATTRAADADKSLTWFAAAWMIVMKGVVLFGLERLIRSEGTVLTTGLARCSCVFNTLFAQPMLLQLDQASMSVSVCVQTWMAACLTQSFAVSRDPHGPVSRGPCDHACCNVCCNHMHLQHVYTASPCIAEYTNGQVPCAAGYGLCIACNAQCK